MRSDPVGFPMAALDKADLGACLVRSGFGSVESGTDASEEDSSEAAELGSAVVARAGASRCCGSWGLRFDLDDEEFVEGLDGVENDGVDGHRVSGQIHDGEMDWDELVAGTICGLDFGKELEGVTEADGGGCGSIVADLGGVKVLREGEFDGVEGLGVEVDVRVVDGEVQDLSKGLIDGIGESIRKIGVAYQRVINAIGPGHLAILMRFSKRTLWALEVEGMAWRFEEVEMNVCVGIPGGRVSDF